MYLGCLPSDLGPQFAEVDWVPVNLLADVPIDITGPSSAKPDENFGAHVFNVRNPQAQL